MKQTETGEQPKASSCHVHFGHDHEHGEICGHKAVKLDEQINHEPDGHLHRDHTQHVDECECGQSLSKPK